MARAAEALHLAPRSVRDLIYAGRLPSVRIGRLHYVRATDLERERRRRLGLRLPQPVRRRRQRPEKVTQPRAAGAQQLEAASDQQLEAAGAQQVEATEATQPGGTTAQRPEPAAAWQKRAERTRVDPELRRQRAAERADVVRRWAQRHEPSAPRVPFAPLTLSEPTTCAVCGRVLRANQPALDVLERGERVCLTCGRRALMVWADQRRLEAAAARRMAQDLSAAPPSAQSPRAAA